MKVDTTWPWMWHPQLYRTHQYTEQLELSLFVVLYADRIGVVGGYWIPESLVCHGHPPTRCHAPPPTPDLLTTGSTSIQRSWSYLSLLGCFQPKFDVFCKRIVLGQCVAVWCCWINVWQDVWSSYLSTCPPPPTPLSLFCLCHGPKWCIKIFYFVHENPRWTRIMVYFLFHDKLSL